jgi:hypothetical protein
MEDGMENTRSILAIGLGSRKDFENFLIPGIKHY